ncbi:MAG: STAS domain-containing protein [Candidatus Dormibacteraeota bacterium]|nr:STAS domain-containing protein [Candidatus Dormibacteraeota bacterium]
MNEQNTISFVVRGPIARPDLPGLYGRFCALLTAGRPTVAWCRLYEVDADAVTVDALARLQLAARRHGCVIRLRGASGDLRDLVAYMGLETVLPD